MRGSIDGLGSSTPISTMLPAVFADDDLAQRFVAGLDDVLAPILNVLDCLDTYFDPALTPADFAQWLGTWVGAETDGTEPEARLRAAVAAAAACTAYGAPGAASPKPYGSPSAPNRRSPRAAPPTGTPGRSAPYPARPDPISTSRSASPTPPRRTRTAWTPSWQPPAPRTCPTPSP